MFDLSGKKALVTGASGGIGGAIAAALHAQGATVALSGTKLPALEALAAKLGIPVNWLYVQNERAALHLDHDAVRVRFPDADPLSVPLLSLEGIVCFGAISVSTPLIQRCASEGKVIVLLSRTGRRIGCLRVRDTL